MSSKYRLLTYGNSAKYSDALEQWIRSITIDSDATELVIYSLPGMGKTTFQKKQIRKGFNVADSDEFTAEWLDKDENKRKGLDRWAEPVKSRRIRQAYEQEMAWRLPLIIWPSNTRFTVTNMFNHAIKGVVKLDQTLVMVRAGSFDEYWRRASQREDLLALGRETLQQWYNDSSSMGEIVNFTVDDWEGEFEEHLTNNISAFGAHHVEGWKRDLSTRFHVGTMLRDSILIHYRKERLHFIGSERQTVSMAAFFGAKIRISGYGFRQPLTLSSVSADAVPADFTPEYSESQGQKKLLTVNMPFYGADCDVIISVGGSPGDHLLDLWKLKPLHKTAVIIDPLPLKSTPPPWITHIQSLFDPQMLSALVSGKSFVFISDIRSDGFSEDDVARDNAEQISWARHILSKFGSSCRGISLKFRAPKNATHITIPGHFDVLLQCYAGGGSEETRLCWRPSNGLSWRVVTLSAAMYRRQLRAWNYLRTRPDVETDQARNLSHYLIEQLDYTKITPNKREIVIGLYTVTNFNRDARQLLNEWSAAGVTYVVNVPFAPIHKALIDAGDVPKLRSNGGDDSSWIPMDFARFDAHSYRVSDFISQLQYARDFAPLPRQASPCNGGSRYMHEWFIVTNASFHGKLPYSSAHTIQNSQTWCVKAITAKIRLIYGLDDSALHRLRRDVVKTHGGDPIDHRLVNGRLVVDGHDMFISISGHLINLLVASTVYAIDFKRWLDTLAFALETKYKSNRKWIALWKQGVLAEDAEKWDRFQLYHGYFDYLMSLEAYIRFCDEFDLFKNNLAVAFVRNGLNDLVMHYPKWRYDHGYAVNDYLAELDSERKT